MPFMTTFTSKSSQRKQMEASQIKESEQQDIAQDRSLSQAAPKMATEQQSDNTYMLNVKIKMLLHEIYKHGLKKNRGSATAKVKLANLMNCLVTDVLLLENIPQNNNRQAVGAVHVKSKEKIRKNIYTELVKLSLFNMEHLQGQIASVAKKRPQPNAVRQPMADSTTSRARRLPSNNGIRSVRMVHSTRARGLDAREEEQPQNVRHSSAAPK